MKNIKNVLILQVAVLIYSLGSIASKYASREPLFSKAFIIYCLILFILLAIYSIIWQQILKKTTLSFAYINKATSIAWGLLLGYILFFEKITFFNILGAIIVIIGIIIVSAGDRNNG